MIEIVTPTIICTLGFSEQVQPWLAGLGALERAPGPMTSAYGFTERTSVATASTALGVSELATNGVTPMAAHIGSTDVVRPTIQRYLGVVETCAVSQRTVIGMTEQTPVSFDSRVGMLERVARPVTTLAGYTELVGVIIGELLGFTAVSTPDAAVVAVFSALVMNAKTGGVGLYAGFPLTSLFKLGNDYYGITADGLVKIDGKTDNGAQIDAVITSGVSDLGTGDKKNVAEGFLTMRCEGDLELTVTYDEQKSITKTGSTGKLGLSDVRFGMPLGSDGNQVQVVIRNVAGADFDFKKADFTIVKRDRRR